MARREVVHAVWCWLAGCSGDPAARHDAGAPTADAMADADTGPPPVCEVTLDCGGAEIPDEPKIECVIRVEDGRGELVHEGPAGVERRGRSSLGFPKAQY